MITFEVRDMTCGHCASTITKAVRSIDRQAKVEIDLAAYRVRIEPTEADAQEVKAAIADAGYTPVIVETVAAQATTAARSGGCCCN